MQTSKNSKSLKREGDNVLQLLPKIREEIISGRIEPASPLRQDELAKRFETSRVPVREALRLLEAEGLVEIVPNKGAIAAPLDIRELVEVYELRVIAETFALKKAIPELSNTQIQLAENIQTELEQSDLGSFGIFNKRFHQALYAPSKRPRLLSHINNLNDVSDRYLRFTINALNYSEKSHEEHRRLLDACKRRDEQEAVAILTQHISSAGESLINYLQNHI